MSRCCHADKVYVGKLPRIGKIGGETQSPSREVIREQRVKVWLMEPPFARVEQVDLDCVDVHSQDLVTERSHAPRMRGAQMPASRLSVSVGCLGRMTICARRGTAPDDRRPLAAPGLVSLRTKTGITPRD